MASAADVLLVAYEDVEPTKDEWEFIAGAKPAGITLFKRNIPYDLDSLKSTLKTLQKKLPEPGIIAIDQEGGRVSRLPAPFPNQGPALMLPDQARLIQDYAHQVGKSLLSLGINTNFAPVLDIYTREDNTAIGDRCFSDNPDGVIRRAGAFIQGHKDAGILWCLKHFPGQGDASADTHASSTTIQADRQTLFSREIKPFMALCQDAPMVMMSHAHFPALDPVLPASTSKTIIQDILAKQLNYQGLVLSDDFLMGAIPQDLDKWSEKLIEAIVAGTDLLLICRDIERIERARTVLQHEIEHSQVFRKRISLASQRIAKLRRNLSR
jgi:beta-N-acetylhexosaminidase